MLFSADGHHLITVGRTIRLWELADVTQPRKVGKPWAGKLTAQPVLSSAGLLATGHPNGFAHLWNPMEQKKLGEPLQGHAEEVSAVAFSPDGRVLAAISGHIKGEEVGDHVVRLWDTATWKEIEAPLGGHTGVVEAAAFSPDNRLYATGGHDGLLRVRILPSAPLS